MKVLMTGFDPFGGESINPAFEAVKLIPDHIAGAEVVKVEIPTVFRESSKALEAAIETHQPDVVICVGQAGGRFDITVERVAINIDDARIPDNKGNQPLDEVIYEDGENAYFASLPVKAMVKHVTENQIPCSVSYTAGTFVCNHIMYSLLYMIDKKYPNIKGGFIHVPYLNQQVMDKKNMPYMPVEHIAKGLELCIEAAINNKEDIKKVGGEIC